MDAENRWLSIYNAVGNLPFIAQPVPGPFKSSFQVHFLFKWKHVDDFKRENTPMNESREKCLKDLKKHLVVKKTSCE